MQRTPFPFQKACGGGGAMSHFIETNEVRVVASRRSPPTSKIRGRVTCEPRVCQVGRQRGVLQLSTLLGGVVLLPKPC